MLNTFILEQDDDDPSLDNTSKFLLPKSAAESKFEAETQLCLEAILEASSQLLESSEFDSASSTHSGS